jgi:hypothetical protein
MFSRDLLRALSERLREFSSDCISYPAYNEGFAVVKAVLPKGRGYRSFNPEPTATAGLHVAMIWQHGTAFEWTKNPLGALPPSPLAPG